MSVGICWGIFVAFVGICSDSFEMSKGTTLTLQHSPATLPFNLKLENVACLLGKKETCPKSVEQKFSSLVEKLLPSSHFYSSFMTVQ